MLEATDELKEFWEKCGWKRIEWSDLEDGYIDAIFYESPIENDMTDFPPELSLDNLFKYSWDIALTVVMKTMECSKENAISLIFKWWEQNIYDGKTPQEALYQAIKQVIL